jgi:hypothetical protein
MTLATFEPTFGVTEGLSSNAELREDFLDFLARRLGVEPAEARHRLSHFLAHYEPESRPRPKTAASEPPGE